MLFLCNFEQSDENNFSYQYIAFAIEGGSNWKNTPYHWFLDKKWGNMNFYFIWATPILLNISRESFFILFTYAQKPIPNAQIDNEVFRSGAPLYIVSVTVVWGHGHHMVKRVHGHEGSWSWWVMTKPGLTQVYTKLSGNEKTKDGTRHMLSSRIKLPSENDDNSYYWFTVDNKK